MALGTMKVKDKEKIFTNSTGTAFDTLGCVRNPPCQAQPNKVWQIDFFVSGSVADSTECVMGLSSLPYFIVSNVPTYIYLNQNSPNSFNVQTFPSANRVFISTFVWYTARFLIKTDSINIYLSGPGFTNQLLESSAPFSGVQNLPLYFQINVKKTANTEFIKVRNFMVSNSLTSMPNVGIYSGDTVASLDPLLKEKY